MPELEIEVPVEASFQVDLGENPALDRTLPVDQWVQVAGMDVHILAMRLAKENVSEWAQDAQSDYVAKDYELEFVMEALPQDHIRIYMLGIDSNAEWISGGSASGGSHVERLEASLNFSRIPKGKIDVRISEAVVIIEGAWEVSWELPAPANVSFAASLIHPNISEEHNGVTLMVKEAVLSDRMTRLELALPGLVPGAELVSTFPSSDEDTIYLEDESGRHLNPVQEIGTAEIGFDPAELRFAGLHKHPKRLLLYIPEAEIFFPGEVSLAVEVPRGLQFHQEMEQVTDIRTRERWVSDAWTVDLLLDIAGYRPHFDQARLERKPRGEMEGMYGYRLELSAEAPTAAEEGVRLSSLQVGRIVCPDGSLQTFDRDTYRRWSRNLPYSRVQPEALKPKETRLLLSIDVTSPVGIDLVPGRYTIDLSGLVVRVLGPWRLRWSMEQ